MNGWECLVLVILILTIGLNSLFYLCGKYNILDKTEKKK